MELAFDINCDLGEEKNVEAAIMPLIQSANIACGAHAGNEELIRHCIRLAKKHQVKIGIHPSYPDRENFGRVVMDIAESDLLKSLKEQINLFVKIVDEESAKIHHLKLHGALYNEAAKNEKLSKEILEMLATYPKEWIIFCPPNSIFENKAIEFDRIVWPEAFLDRKYESDGSLRARKFADAILHDKQEVFNQFKMLLRDQKVIAADEQTIDLSAKTFCIHGDHDNSVEILNHLKSKWENGRL